MSRRDDAYRLEHMLSHAREAIELVRDRTRSDLDTDRVFNLALVRLIEIIGEAGAKVSDECRARHSEIPWVQIIGTRNRVVHGYDEVDFDILWQIVSVDLEVLVPRLEEAMRQETG